MSETEKQMVKNFHKYLMDSKVQKQLAETVLKNAQEFQGKNKAADFMEKSFKKNRDKFETAVKRYLYILNKLLEKDFKSGKNTYRNLISQRIVQYYLFFFSFICKNSLLEFIPELKLARMKWAGLVSDEAFFQLKQAVLKEHKIYIDKGFSEENIAKIKQVHKKRGLSSKKINQYFGIQKRQEKDLPKIAQKNPRNSSQSQSDSDSQRSLQNSSGNKRIKVNQDINEKYRFGSISTHKPSSMDREIYPSQPRNLPDPRYFHQSERYPNNYGGMGNMAQGMVQGYSQMPPTMYPQLYNPYPSPYYSQSLKSYPSAQINENKQNSNIDQTYRSSCKQQLNETKIPQSNILETQKLRNNLFNDLNRCSKCGMVFETKQLEKIHFNNHFFTSLEKANEAQLKGKMKKESSIQLLDLKSWEEMDKKKEIQYKFEVLIKGLNCEVPDCCFFCNQELEVSFSPHYESWVYQDSIKIKSQKSIKLMHYSCYEAFKSDDSNST